MISITNDRGEEVTRQIVGVGALQPGEQRKFTFAVEVFTPAGAVIQEKSAKLRDTGRNVPESAATESA